MRVEREAQHQVQLTLLVQIVRRKRAVAGDVAASEDEPEFLAHAPANLLRSIMACSLRDADNGSEHLGHTLRVAVDLDGDHLPV